MNHETLPSIILDVAGAIAAAGGRAILVGGFVRDQVLYERERAVPDASGGPDDIDIEVYGLSLEELEGVLEAFGEVISVGRSFGVFKVKRLFPDNSQDCSFSLPRRDNKVGSGHRGFQVELDPELGFEEAARRRDRFHVINKAAWQFSVVFPECRFWIEKITLAGTPGHEELDHGLGLPAKVRWTRRQVGSRPMVRGHYPWQVAAEQSGETGTQ